jgi:transcriptional regulator with XRE-family HTH domain
MTDHEQRESGGRYQLPFLRAWRRKRFLSIRALQAASGVSTNTIILLESQRSLANPGTVGKLAKALDITPEELVYTDPTPRQRVLAEEEGETEGQAVA